MQSPVDAAETVMRLPVNLTIATADDCRTLLLDALTAAPAIVLDASDLGAVDIAGVQLLIAARRSAERAGKRLRLAAPADGALRQALLAAGCLADDPAQARDGFWRGEG